MSESNDNLIGYIASTVESMRDEMTTMRNEITTMRNEMATMRNEMATMRNEMATKTDLARLDGKLSERIDTATTAIRADFEQVHLRLDTMEHGISSRFEHVEGEISRLRSAVYLLGKDRPEVLRFLGQTSS